MEPTTTPICLIARSQALFEAFAVPDSLPTIDSKWIDAATIPLTGPASVSVRAWLGRGPISHRLGTTAILFFDHGEDDYPVFTYPSESPKGAAVKGSTVAQELAARDNTSIFCLEAIAVVPVAPESWDQASKNELSDELSNIVHSALSNTRGILNTLVGAYALYQYPLVWKPIYDRHLYLFVNADTKKSTSFVQPLVGDNFIPFRLDASKHVLNDRFTDAVTERAVDIVGAGLKEPFLLLKDSLWHSDIRTRFLLQFWIVEYLAEKLSSVKRDEGMRELVNSLVRFVAEQCPGHLEQFKLKKGELLRHTLVEKVTACCDALKVQYDDSVFKRAKRVRDNLSHGTAYDEAELVLMEQYIRELSRLMLRRALESKGVFLAGEAKPVSELPVIVPSFVRLKDKQPQAASFTMKHEN